jgi:hypothetical protein
VEEGTAQPCGEEGEVVGWSEDAVEWCGVRYARGDLPPFDTIGLRGTLFVIVIIENQFFLYLINK